MAAQTSEMFTAIEMPAEGIRSFCARWGVTKFEIFGSVLRPDFKSGSDVDVLVSFAPGVLPSVYDFVDMKEELTNLFGRNVDLIRRGAVEESRRAETRKEILESARVVYAK